MNPPKASTLGPPSSLITRREAARILGISSSELRRREDAGIYDGLYEIEPNSGWRWYNRVELCLAAKAEDDAKVRIRDRRLPMVTGARLAKIIRGPEAPKEPPKRAKVDSKRYQVANAGYSGEEAALVFAEIERGVQVTDIVQKLKLMPDAVIAISESYSRVRSAMMLSRETIASLRKLCSRGEVEISDEASLLEAVEANVKPVMCAKCRAKPARVCSGCLEKGIERAVSRVTPAPVPAPVPVPNGAGEHVEEKIDGSPGAP